MKAALARAAGYISSSGGLEEAPRVCRDCGEPLQSWESNRCGDCTRRTLSEVADNSVRWMAETAAAPIVVFHVDDDKSVPSPVKPDGMTDEDWDDFQSWVMDNFEAYPLTEAGLEMAGAFTPRCD